MKFETMSPMIYVVTYVEARPDATAEAMEWLTFYREATRAEEDNRGIEALQEIYRPNRFVVVEGWNDESSFQIHEASAHTAQFRSGAKAGLNSPNDRRVHHGFAAGSEAVSDQTGALYVVTHVDVPPPRRDETEVLLQQMAEHSRMDPGNVRYDVFQQNAPRTNHFTVFATWSGEPAFVRHSVQLHTRQFRESLGPMLGALYDERLYRLLPAS